jgi:hypothetical protein
VSDPVWQQAVSIEPDMAQVIKQLADEARAVLRRCLAGLIEPGERSARVAQGDGQSNAANVVDFASRARIRARNTPPPAPAPALNQTEERTVARLKGLGFRGAKTFVRLHWVFGADAILQLLEVVAEMPAEERGGIRSVPAWFREMVHDDIAVYEGEVLSCPSRRCGWAQVAMEFDESEQKGVL